MKGQFGPNGALFDGWESRRHNPTYDWCVVLLFLLSKVFELMEVIMQDNHQAGSARKHFWVRHRFGPL
mgnify:FL=1|jgi:allantoicase